MITVYGIPNCDTIKRARSWLDANGIPYCFHDYRKDGVDPLMLNAWVEELGFEVLLNRRGTTWRALPDAAKDGIDAARAVDLMVASPAMIKRPVFDLGTRRVVGFGAGEQAIIAAQTS